MEWNELIDDLWEIISLESSDANKVLNIKEKIQEFADEEGLQLDNIDDEFTEEF